MPPAGAVHAYGRIPQYSAQGARPAEPYPAELRQPYRSPFVVQPHYADRLAGERDRHAAHALVVYGCPRAVIGVLPVVVGGVQAAEDLLPALGGQVSHPIQVPASMRQVGALLDRAHWVMALLPGEPALLQGHIPQRAACMPPADQALSLIRCRVEPVLAAYVSLHRFIIWLAMADARNIHACRYRVLNKPGRLHRRPEGATRSRPT